MDRDIGRFTVFFITACRLSQLLTIADDVENVVLNLEGNAYVVGDFVKSLNVLFGSSGQYCTDGKSAVDEAGGLVAVDVLKEFGRNRLRIGLGFAVFGFEVCALSADHAENAGIAGENLEGTHNGCSIFGCLCSCECGDRGLIGKVEKGIACQNSHSFAVNNMCGLAAAAVFVIVHSREVIVDQ